MLLVIACLPLLFAAWVIAAPILLERGRRRVRARPFPQAWREILDRRVPYVGQLPPHLQRRLEEHIQVFVAEKSFMGCAGLAITDEVRVTIAAQACLLLLDRSRGYYPNLRQILVYPGAFVIERLRAEPSGVLQEQRHVLSGESWSQGQVIVSWEDVLEGAAVADDGRNVVIHEFAHQLDQEKGHANGAPWLGRRDRYARWSQVMSAAYAQLQFLAATQQPSLLNYYGASSPAEFFAVVSEVFFEQPGAMAAMHPELYVELATFYGLDPLEWAPGTQTGPEERIDNTLSVPCVQSSPPAPTIRK